MGISGGFHNDFMEISWGVYGEFMESSMGFHDISWLFVWDSHPLGCVIQVAVFLDHSECYHNHLPFGAN